MINSIVLQPLRNAAYIQYLTDTLILVSVAKHGPGLLKR
jgi:hypothetical protein